MDFNCFGVSGCASGSAWAAAVMALSSSEVGIAMGARLDALDIRIQFRPALAYSSRLRVKARRQAMMDSGAPLFELHLTSLRDDYTGQRGNPP